ncbi:4'-phosphopantetheinyl transferase family protein [Thermodesulfobacteriota bacterium]
MSIKRETTNTKPQTIHPVILAVPGKSRNLRGRDMVRFLSRYARQALDISSEKSGAVLKKLRKDKQGAPQPVDGNYWSLTHKPKYVGAVIAPDIIGIDLEEIRPCSESLIRKISNAHEWRLGGGSDMTRLFRYWTSKESVLKAAGTGMKGLSKCLVEEVLDDHKLIIRYMDRRWCIEHFYFNGHIAAIVKNSFLIEWHLLPESL